MIKKTKNVAKKLSKKTITTVKKKVTTIRAKSKTNTLTFEQAIKKNNIVLVELPTKDYMKQAIIKLKTLVNTGYTGVYISFQRPIDNLLKILKKEDIDTKKLVFVDVASSMCGGISKNAVQCIPLAPNVDMDDLIRVTYLALDKLKEKKRFIFIDSLTTIALHKPLSDIMRYSEFLMTTVKKDEQQVLLVLFVAADLRQKRFIKDIALRVDEVVHV